jgi:hypothetical protein
VNLDHHALLVTALGMAGVALLLLAVVGAGIATRITLDAADELRARRDARRTTAVAPVMAEPVPAPPRRQPEPDLSDKRHGTDDHALNTCRDIWWNSPGGDQ